MCWVSMNIMVYVQIRTPITIKGNGSLHVVGHLKGDAGGACGMI